MSKIKNYAIIGAGMMGREHINNIALLENTKLVALADPESSSLEESTKKSLEYWPESPNCYASYQEMLSAESLDAVVIVSPNYTHFEILKHIFIHYPTLAVLAEKPICVNKQQAMALLDYEKNHKAPFWVAMEYRYIPVAQNLLKQINENKIGELKTFSIREHRFPFLEKVGDWNRFNEKTGGTLVEKCCHFFDLMNLVTQSKPIRVYASGAIDVNHLDERYDDKTPDIIDNAFVIVDFEDGKRGFLDICMFAEGSYFQEELCAIGNQAKIEALIPAVQRFWPGALENPETAPKPKLVLSPRDPKGPVETIIEAERAILHAGDHQGSTYYQHKKFLEAVEKKGPVEVTMKDGVYAVLIGLAAEESVKTKQAVLLDLP